jgi:membrane protein implicated in regulation of membrane protease activity
MNAEKKQRCINFMIAMAACLIAVAAVWELATASRTARIVAFAAFGALCIFLRALPRKFLVPKPKTERDAQGEQT